MLVKKNEIPLILVHHKKYHMPPQKSNVTSGFTIDSTEPYATFFFSTCQ